MTSAPVPVPGFVGNREARNLFLPVPFQRGLRIEAETLEPTWLIFWQIDYRLRDKTVQGQRLAQVLVAGYRQHAVLSVQGRGQWLGMALYNTGHELWQQALQGLDRRLGGGRYEVALQSNLWLLDDEFCQLFAEHKVDIGTSLDGPEEITDHQRGRGYFARTMQGVHKANCFGLNVGCIATFTPYTASRWPDVFDFFLDERLNFSIHAAVPPLDFQDGQYAISPESRPENSSLAPVLRGEGRGEGPRSKCQSDFSAIPWAGASPDHLRDPYCTAYKQTFDKIVQRAIDEMASEENIEAVAARAYNGKGHPLLRKGPLIELVREGPHPSKIARTAKRIAAAVELARGPDISAVAARLVAMGVCRTQQSAEATPTTSHMPIWEMSSRGGWGPSSEQRRSATLRITRWIRTPSAGDATCVTFVAGPVGLGEEERLNMISTRRWWSAKGSSGGPEHCWRMRRIAWESRKGRRLSMLMWLRLWWLRKRLASSRGPVRQKQNAAYALGKLGDARVVEPLIKALGDGDGEVRLAAAESLGKLGDARAIGRLIKALADGWHSVTKAAAEALARLGETKWMSFIQGDEADLARLGASRDARAVESLIWVLDKAAYDVRWNAAEALGTLGDPRAVPPLITALGDKDRDVRRNTAAALTSFATTHPGAIGSSWEAVRTTIQRWHTDEWVSTGNSSDCTSEHVDKGIGLDFPPEPPAGTAAKTDF